MSSDVVRWSVVSSDNQPQNMPQSQCNDNHCQHKKHKQTNNIDTSTIVASRKPQLISKLILLTVWLVIIQHLNVVLSEPILDTKIYNQIITNNNNNNNNDNNLTTRNNLIVNNKLSDDVPVKSLNDVNDLINEYQNHQIHVDDDIANDKHYTSTWAAHIPGGIHIANQVADEHGFVNLGQIFEDHYHFHHKEIRKRSVNPSHHHQNRLNNDDRVHWSKQQRIKSRQKRDFLSFHNPDYSSFTTGKNRVATTDPKWPQMWYLHRGNGLDMNVIPAWKEGVTGQGIVVTILDDGLESDHPDLRDSFDPKASYDVNSHDEDPMPHYDLDDSNRHGTRCAGEVAATFNNSLCCTGIAYGASVGGVRMLDGDVTDAVEARSLSLNPQHIDIYSASWGPDDDGKTVDGPGELATRAFIEGVTKGRNGKGSIFIWASGNGGKDHDNCNCDGYTNSIWTLSISSATERGLVPWYSEKCSSTLATTYSSGSKEERQVVTTDLHHSCTTSHTGTSASAPLAAGIAALVLEANRNLTWRDLQHIVVRTAKPADLKDSSWSKNGVGRRVSHSFGYGLMDAMAMIKLARTWKTVPEQQRCEIYAPSLDKTIAPKSYIVISLKIAKHQCESVNFLEHVQAKITLTTQRRGDIQIHLTSPAGTKVTLLTSRSHDNSRSGFNQWPFMSVHTWGESPHGQWLLEIRNDGRYMAQVTQWGLIMHGTDTTAQPNDPSNFEPHPADPDFFGQNSLDFDAQTSGQWRHMQQIGESHVDVQRTAASNDQTDSACIKSSPDKYCIVCEQTTFIYKGRCYMNCPDRSYMVTERPPRAVITNVPQKRCADCHKSCNRCRGPMAYECTECLNESSYREVSSNETYCDVNENAPSKDLNGDIKAIKMDHILNETEHNHFSHKSFLQLFYDHFSLFTLIIYVVGVLIALIIIRLTYMRISTTKDARTNAGNDNKKNYAYNRITYDGTNDHILMEQALVNNSTSDSSDEIDIEISKKTAS